MKTPEFLFAQQFRDLPKVELHRHLDCSMRWSTFCELAPSLGLDWPATAAQQRAHYLITQPMKDLNSVLRKFLSSQKVLASEEILTRLAFEACEDAFNEGIQLLELRYAPTYITDGHSTLSFEKIQRSFIKGLEMAQKKYPMAVGLICIIQRNRPLSEAEKVCDFAIDYKGSFIALDLADSEVDFNPSPFAPLFMKAKKSGLHITVHSGESPHPQAPQWVMDSIEYLGAERIGHGVQVIHSPEVMEKIRKNKILLEVCPVSNWLTQAFPSHEEHPVRKLWNAGIDMAFCSDDPGIFATTLNDDYEILHHVHGFTRAEFEAANNKAAAHSFLPQNLKNKFWPIGNLV
ncbi:MAG: adenosine deaminase [Bdellovibrionota bacterium]